MQIFQEDTHTRESSFCHLTAADAAVVAVDGEAAAEVAAAADAVAAAVAAADAAGDAADPGHKIQSGVASLPITITIILFRHYMNEIYVS